MNLKCKINGKEYNAAQGIPFSDEYNETLDSCSVIIPHSIGKIKMYPYDDFYIYNDDKSFYKHFLIHQFDEENINLTSKIYKYKFQLFSETKGLETVQLPNTSVTQAVYIDKKKSVYQYICDFVYLYNPKIKIVKDEELKTWEYTGKYKIADKTCVPRNPLLENDLEGIFGDVFAPEFSLNSPNLRDLLAKLFLVKDMIPVVEDNVIYAMDITKRHGIFSTKDVNYIAGSRSSENHCDNLKRTYYDALSQDYSARRVEMLGFRNSDSALMTISNMRLETNFPIYKINKVHMCYYKRVYIKNNNAKLFNEDETYSAGSYVYLDNDSNVYYRCKITGKYSKESLSDSTYWQTIKKERVFLCKQDITKLVQLNSRRELLSQDWDDFKNSNPKSVDDLAKYKLCTVGYDIGSKYITGWGNIYTYPEGFWDKKKTYIQNIAQLMDSFYKYGIYDYDFFAKDLNPGESISITDDFFENIVSPVFKTSIDADELKKILFGSIADQIDTDDINDSIKMKSLFFEIDYNAFVNGTVVYSKDYGRDNITNNDNASSSLTIVEADGLYQKEKINRFGNKGLVFTARHASINDLQPLGSVYTDDEVNDVIIYHREYSICDNVVIATYYGMHDYVLKNYFTSVYAKHRPYSLMSYGESIRRSENNKTILVLSKEKVLFENLSNKENNIMNKIFSFHKKSLEDEKTGGFITPDKINYAYITHEKEDVTNYYATDVNAFISGTSLCFNMSMYDNASMGVYIKTAVPEFTLLEGSILDFEDTTKDVTGSVQDWYMAVDDVDTGYTKEMGFYLCHLDKDSMFDEGIINSGMFEISVYSSSNLESIEIIDKQKFLNKTKKYLSDYQVGRFSFGKTVIDNWLCLDFDDDEQIVGSTDDLLNEFGIKVVFNATQQPSFTITANPLGTENQIEDIINRINMLPKIEETKIAGATNVIGDTFVINKDNKEIIDMTYQYEPITTDKNVIFSSLLMNLSDLVSNTHKKSDDIIRTSTTIEGNEIKFYTANKNETLTPVVILEVPKNIIGEESFNKKLSGSIIAVDDGRFSSSSGKDIVYDFEFEFKKTEYISTDNAVLVYRQKIVMSKNIGSWLIPKYVKVDVINDDVYLFLTRMTNDNKPANGSVSYPDSEECYYYSNFDFAHNKIQEGCDIGFLNSDGKPIQFGELSPNKIKANFGLYPMDYGTNTLNISQMKTHKVIVAAQEVEIKKVDSKNMYVVISKDELKKTVVYDEFKAKEQKITVDGVEKTKYFFDHPSLEITNLRVPDTFSYVYEENEIPYIKVDLQNSEINEDIKSIQYWFRDEESNSFKFVFGVNITDEERNQEFIKIYISAVKSRDERVFNQNYEVVGNVVNFADSNNEKIYGEDQYYYDII